MKTTSDLSWENFELGFWHPFGSHGRESPEEIIDRKRRDRPGSLTTTADCREYRFVGRDDVDWRPVPPLIRVPHPFGPKKEVASAFVVRCIYHPVKLLQRPFVEWFKGDKWDDIPTRPEFLIRRGGKIAMPNVSAVLELRSPYLAVVRRDSGTQFGERVCRQPSQQEP